MKRKSQRGQDDCDGLSSLLSPQERTEYRRLSSSQQSTSPISTIRGMATQGGSQNTDTEGYIKRRETPLYTMNKSKWVCTDKHGHVDEFEFDMNVCHEDTEMIDSDELFNYDQTFKVKGVVWESETVPPTLTFEGWFVNWNNPRKCGEFKIPFSWDNYDAFEESLTYTYGEDGWGSRDTALQNHDITYDFAADDDFPKNVSIKNWVDEETTYHFFYEDLSDALIENITIVRKTKLYKRD